MLRSDVAGSMRSVAISQTAPGHWLPWGRLRDVIRTGRRQTPAALGAEIFEYYAANAQEGTAFAGDSNGLPSLVMTEIARVLDLGGRSLAVDVGGAHGSLVVALLRANPPLRGLIVDLPHVVEGAQRAVEAAGLAGRCRVVAGDFFAGVPAGGDVYLLKQILHDWNDEQARIILGHCARAMRPGGRLFLIEMLVPDDRRPTPVQLMDLNMLVMLPGRERTVGEYRALLERTGLELLRVIETRTPLYVLEAAVRPDGTAIEASRTPTKEGSP
jgi:hypothetical protein